MDLLEKSWTATVVFKAVAETPEGWIISGPVASFKRDYDGETMERAGILKGLKMFFNLGAHIDYNHRYAEEEAKGNPQKALEYLIGKGIRVEDQDGVPTLVAMLFKAKDKAGELSESIVKALRRGVRFGFSIEGKAKKHHSDESRIVETEIHRITIAPSTKGFDQWIKLGADRDHISKALELEDAGFAASDLVSVCKAIRADLGWSETAKATAKTPEEVGCSTCGDPECGHQRAYHEGFVAGALKMPPFHIDAKTKETIAAPVDPKTLDRATTSHTYSVGHATGKLYREVYDDQFPGGETDPNAPDPKAAQRKAEHTLAASLHEKIIPTFFQRWTLERDNADRCPECGAVGGGGKAAPSTSKAVVAEAQQCCPRCQRKMYCLTCHKEAGKPVEKALLTGEGVVEPGTTGGAALRSQSLRGAGASKCKHCGCAVDSGSDCCADCESETKKSPEMDMAEADPMQAAVTKSLQNSGLSERHAKAVAKALGPQLRNQRQAALVRPVGRTRPTGR